MQRSKLVSITISLLAFATTFGHIATASAEAPSQGGAAVQQDVLATLHDVQALLASPSTSTPVSEGLKRAEAILREMPADRFVGFDEHLLVRLHKLRDLAAASQNAVIESTMTTPLKSSGFPSAEYPDIGFDFVLNASTSAPSGSTNTGTSTDFCSTASWPNPEARFIFLNLSLVGEALRDTARRICDQTVIILGEGANLAPVCIISDVAYLAIRGIQDNMFLCADVMLEAESAGSYDRMDHVHDDLVDAEANLATDISSLRTGVIGGANANETLLYDLDADLLAHNANLEARMQSVTATLDMVARFVEEFRLEELRIRIECNLADADGKAVGDFMLPEFLGGFLETVRAVTAETIQAVNNAGGDVGSALSLLQTGDRRFAEGDFAGAFDQYGLAYRTATR